MDKKKLSVIICCYNERATIREIIERTSAVDLGESWTREILVIDNFSTDGTREILQQIDDPEIRVIFTSATWARECRSAPASPT